MAENIEHKLSIFSGMFSLIFKSPEEGSGLRLPEIEFVDEDRDVEETKIHKEVKNSARTKFKKIPRKKNTACLHINKRHYAKGMCNNCYHRIGRQKKAWSCTHIDRPLYAIGMCQTCYLRNYHKSGFNKTPK